MRAISTLILAISLSSCFSYGLPEPLAGYAQTQKSMSAGATPPTLAMVSSIEAKPNRRDYLGNQYFLGLIPLTSVYFEHGNQYLLEELTLDILSSTGERVLSGNLNSISQSIEKFSLNHVIKPKLVGLKANVWDLFLARRVSVQGEVQLEFFEPDINGNLVLREKTHSNIDFVKYKSQAQGASLAALIHQAIAGGINHSLELRNFKPNPRAFRRLFEKYQSQPKTNTNLVYIQPPRFPEELSNSLAREITDSYGFPNWPAYNSPQLSRALQRGFSSGIESFGLSPVSIVGSQGEAFLGLNSLNTIIKHIKLDQETKTLGIEIDWYLDSQPRKGSCIANIKANDKKDGAWIFALEKSSAALAVEIFEISGNHQALRKNNFAQNRSYHNQADVISLKCRSSPE